MNNAKVFTVKLSKDIFGDPKHYVLSFFYDTSSFEMSHTLSSKEDLKNIAITINKFLEDDKNDLCMSFNI